ncbi:MAG: hypothetical protein HFJ98_03790 [Eubacterium sp.]|nr:hypothetical protein [Eubacterium sp.]
MKKFLSNAIISIAAIAVGYGAISLPFHLFDNLTGIQMRIIFIAEILIYFAIFSAFFLIREHKENCRKKEQNFQKRHNERINKRNKTVKGIRISNYDLAA